MVVLIGLGLGCCASVVLGYGFGCFVEIDALNALLFVGGVGV